MKINNARDKIYKKRVQNTKIKITKFSVMYSRMANMIEFLVIYHKYTKDCGKYIRRK